MPPVNAAQVKFDDSVAAIGAQDVQGAIEALVSRIQSCETVLVGLQAGIATNTAAIAENGTSLATHESSISSNAMGLADLTQAVEANTQGRANQATSLQSLDERLVNVEGNLAEWQIQLGVCEDQSQVNLGLIGELERRIAPISTETIDGHPSIVFDGVNVHLRNGSGATAPTNGVGNLIVGYNEPPLAPYSGGRDGSHCVVIGPHHQYSSCGGFIAGINNAVSGPHSSVCGGEGNQAGGERSSVLGGTGWLAIDPEQCCSGDQQMLTRVVGLDGLIRVNIDSISNLDAADQALRSDIEANAQGISANVDSISALSSQVGSESPWVSPSPGNLHYSGNVNIGGGLAVGTELNAGMSSLSNRLEPDVIGLYETANETPLIGYDENTRGYRVGNNTIHITEAGNVGIGKTEPTNPLEMACGAYVNAAGVWMDHSAREAKENIRQLVAEEAHSALVALEPVRFNYKVDREEDCVGFIAEDVPLLVASKDRKGLSAMEIAAVLTKVVQVQQAQIKELRASVKALSAEK